MSRASRFLAGLVLVVAARAKESNWLPAPAGTFSLFMRGYWAEQAMLDSS